MSRNDERRTDRRLVPAFEVAEDRGFEPLRAVNPTRFPSERHRPLGESSAAKATCPDSPGRIGIRRLCGNPPCGGISLNPPGPEGSKGRWALPGAWGAFSCPALAGTGRRGANGRKSTRDGAEPAGQAADGLPPSCP